jgi:hypothetical protein
MGIEMNTRQVAVNTKFTDDFAFQLTATEFKNLRSQIVTLKSQTTDNLKDISNWSQFVTSSSRHHSILGIRNYEWQSILILKLQIDYLITGQMGLRRLNPFSRQIRRIRDK